MMLLPSRLQGALLVLLVGFSFSRKEAMALSVTTSSNTASVSTKSIAAQHAKGTCIVGGGLAGLSAAVALRSIASVESVQVLEKSSQAHWESPMAGAAIQIGPNGLKALKALGGEELVTDICKEGTCLVGNAIVLPQTGIESNGENAMIIPDTTEKETGLPQVLIRWGVLRQLLTNLLNPDCITTGVGKGIVGYSNNEELDGGRKCVEPVTADQKTVLPASLHDSAPPLLIAADGIYSTFQSLVHTGETLLPSDSEKAKRANIKDGGRINIKAVAPVDLGPNFKPGTTYSFFSPGGAAACFAGPAGDGYTYWAISIADETDSGRGNIQRFLSDTDPTDKSSVKRQLLSKLRALEAPECQFAIDLIEETDAETIFVARSEEREHVRPSLVSKDGMVVLVGDAAHSMAPAYGQAASFAFEDAATLATCIRDSADLQSALNEYSEARVSRCVEMQQRSAERTAKATRGEKTEDVSKWIFEWEI